MSPASRLTAGAERILGRPLTADEGALFGKYMSLLLKWDRVYRLVGSQEPDWIVDNLFLDSLLFARFIPAGRVDVIDIGSGAGIPGIPLRIVRPDIALTMVEARRRRASFLRTAVRELGLTRARVANERVEALLPAMAATFDVAVSRCAAKVDAVLSVGAALVRAGGLVVVSGPPAGHTLVTGSWVELDAGQGRSRRFAVLRT